MGDPSGVSRAYRAVSEEEYQQILRTSTFEVVVQGCEGKHFADTLAGANRFGEALFGIGKYRLIEADVPDNALSLCCWENLDGCGPARFLQMDDLGHVRPRPYRESST